MTIALIAGTGGLPPHLAHALMAQGRVPVVCEMRGFPSEIEGEFTRIPFRIETLGTLLATLTSLGVRDVCMAGAVQRPAVDPSAIDAATAPLVPRLMDAMAKGDDGTLRAIVALFEEHGFNVIGAHQIAPDLLPSAGILTQVAVPDVVADIAAAMDALADMGRADQGQAMILRGSAVIAREDARGTEAMLQDFCAPPANPPEATDIISGALDRVGDAIGDVADWLSGGDTDPLVSGDGAILFKGPKPNQIMTADMPLIGPQSAKMAAKAGLAGIIIPAGGVMVLDLAQVVATLDAQGMFLWVMPDGAP